LAEILRQVVLPQEIPGALFLSSMPGRDGPMEQAIQDMRDLGIDRIVCLTPDDEIRMKSPDYAAALKRGVLPCSVQRFPIADFGVPDDRRAFLSLVRQLGDSLRRGERLLVHCSAGFGRCGTVATCAIVALGIEPDAAREAVTRGGGRPEHDLVHWLAGEGP
jgi:protein-tyrosine phosphatase